MATNLITPHDEITGLPLPIAPRCEELPMDRPEVADWHHGFHPRKALEGTGDLAKLALRNIGLQKVERELHNESPLRYHKFFRGPELPSDESDIFARCVMASAGFIPRRVIHLTDDGPVERDATPKEIEFLHTPHDKDEFGYRYVRYNYGPVRDFFRDYVIKQELVNVKPLDVEEFLLSKDRNQRLMIGRRLLDEAIDLATGSIRTNYITMKQKEMLHPAMAHEPIQYLHDRLGTVQQKDEMLPRLRRKLIKAVAA